MKKLSSDVLSAACLVTGTFDPKRSLSRAENKA